MVINLLFMTYMQYLIISVDYKVVITQHMEKIVSMVNGMTLTIALLLRILQTL